MNIIRFRSQQYRQGIPLLILMPTSQWGPSHMTCSLGQWVLPTGAQVPLASRPINGSPLSGHNSTSGDRRNGTTTPFHRQSSETFSGKPAPFLHTADNHKFSGFGSPEIKTENGYQMLKLIDILSEPWFDFCFHFCLQQYFWWTVLNLLNSQ